MNRIDRYIIKRWLLFFLPSLGVLAASYVAGDAAFQVLELLKRGMTTKSVFLHFGLKLPTIFYQMAPIASLLATLLTITGMKRSGELGTMFTSGISGVRIGVPMLVTAALVSLFSLYIDEYVAPVSNRMSRDQVRAASGSNYVVGTDRIWLLESKRIIHIRNVEDRGNMLIEPTVLVIDAENPSYLQQRTDARKAQWIEGSWLAENSITRYFDGPEVKRTEKVEKRVLPISITPEEFYRVRRKPEEMTRNELTRYVQNLRLANLPFSWYEVRIYRKSAGAALSVLFTILAIPVGFVVPVRGGLPLGIGLSVILATVFWTLFSLTLSLGYTGLLAAAAAAWSVNVVFFVAGILTLFLLKHPRLI